MEVVHQCPHYQRNCILTLIKVMFSLHAARSFILASFAMTKSTNIRKDVRCKGCSSKKFNILNVSIAMKSKSLVSNVENAQSNSDNILALSVVYMKITLTKSQTFFIV